mgnify:CR=1 FL=1
MTVQSSLGTTISIHFGVPATYDTDGFDAIMTFSEVGEVADVGEFGGSMTPNTHTPVKTGIVNKVEGPIDYGNQTLQMARMTGDDGQVIAKAGFDGANKGKVHSFKVVYVDGLIEYYTGIITAFTSNVGSASAVRNAGITVALNNKVLVKEPA